MLIKAFQVVFKRFSNKFPIVFVLLIVSRTFQEVLIPNVKLSVQCAETEALIWFYVYTK